MNVILKDGQKDCIDPAIIKKYCLGDRKVTPFSKLKIEGYTPFVECVTVTEGIEEVFDLESEKEEERDEQQQSEWDL